MNHLRLWCLLIALVGVLALTTTHAQAESSGWLKALQVSNPDASMTRDGLVKLSSTAEYVPITPAELPDETTPTPAVSIIQSIPLGQTPSDLILFSDGHALLRVVTLLNGRKSFPAIEGIPDSVKTGIIADGVRLPEMFFMPTAWKFLAGDLLNPDSPESSTPGTSRPLLTVQREPAALIQWSPAQAKIERQIPLPCIPEHLTLLTGQDAVAFTCPGVLKLYKLSLKDAQGLISTELPADIGDLAWDNKRQLLYVSFPSLTELYRLNTGNMTWGSSINLPYPTKLLAFSAFRNRLYASSVDPLGGKIPGQITPAEPLTWFRRNFVEPARPKSKRTDIAEQRKPPGVQVINTLTNEVERIVSAYTDIDQMLIQDDKILWMTSASRPVIQGLDLRWQEMTPEIALPEKPVHMATQGPLLYLTLSAARQLLPLDSKTLSLGQPIMLEPGPQPRAFIVDSPNQQGFMVATGPGGLEIINLERRQWVGTQQMEFLAGLAPQWLTPAEVTPSEQVRIKFRDGRLLHRIDQALQWESSLSDPHVPPTAPTPQAP